MVDDESTNEVVVEWLLAMVKWLPQELSTSWLMMNTMVSQLVVHHAQWLVREAWSMINHH